MYSSDDETAAVLWQAVRDAFPYRSDYGPDEVRSEINRIAAKCLESAVGWSGPAAFDATTCEIRRAVFDGDELASLVRYHQRANLSGRTTPIVVVQVDQQFVVIEGNNRVNAWIGQGDLSPRDALVIAPRIRGHAKPQKQ